MKKLHILFLLSFLSILSLVFTNPAQAEEELDLSDAEIIYEDDEIRVGTFGDDEEIANYISSHQNAVTQELTPEEVEEMISPLAVGPGGRAVITAGNSGRIVYWTVTPKSAWPWVFNGQVSLRYYSGTVRNVSIYGAGAIGSSTSGFVEMNRNKGGRAHLSGTAYNAKGTKMSVLPGVSVAFRNNW